MSKLGLPSSDLSELPSKCSEANSADSEQTAASSSLIRACYVLRKHNCPIILGEYGTQKTRCNIMSIEQY